MRSSNPRMFSLLPLVGLLALNGCGGSDGGNSAAAPLVALAASTMQSPAPTPSPTPSPTLTIATASSGFTAVQQWKGLYGPLDVKSESGAFELELKTKGESDVYVTRNAIAVGGQSGWHTHPGPSLITVTVGEVVAYDSDDPQCAPVRYTTGQGFVDFGDHAHLLRNESGAPAETVAVQFLPKGSARRSDAPQPAHCTV